MFASLWRWLTSGWGANRSPAQEERNIIGVDTIPTWSVLFDDNGQEIPTKPSGEHVQTYEIDPEINDKISLFEGDITCLRVDAITSATDCNLSTQGGVSATISRAAGRQLGAELTSLRGCRPGEAKTTRGYDLKAKYVIHTVGPAREEPDLLECCYKSCLKQVERKQMKSIAFCCISTGNHGYPADKAVHVALKTVRAWLEDLKRRGTLNNVDRVVFSLFSEMDVLLYITWAQVYFPCPPNRRSQPVAEYDASDPNVTAGDDGSMHVDEKLLIEKKRNLQPLPGFIEITSEPDMMGLDDDSETRRAQMPCGHVIGPESMTLYARSEIKRGRHRFCCPAKDCNSEWDYVLVRHVACFTISERQETEKKIADIYLDKERGKQKCPGCKTWCVRVPGTGICVRCPLCTRPNGRRFDFCWRCCNPWKSFLSTSVCGNSGCTGTDKRIELLARCPTKQIYCCSNCPTLRGCPRCGLIVEHKNRCAHVTCSKCVDFSFCFICLREKRDGKYPCRFLGACQLAPRQISLPGSE